MQNSDQEDNFIPPPYALKIPPEYRYKKSGVPFDHKTRKNIDAQIVRVNNGLASLIVIDGTMGKGKTTLATHIADYINGEPISFEEYLSMGGKQFMTKVDKLTDKRLPVIVYDEAGDFNRRGSLQKFNAQLNRFFDTYRTFKIIVIVVLPNFRVIDSQLMGNGVPRLLLHVTRRNRSAAELKGYSLKRMYYLLDKMKKASVPNLAYKKVQPNFDGYFKNLPPERSKELDAYSTSSKKSIMKETRINMNDFITRADIANHYGRTLVWAGQKIKQFNIPSKERIGHREYFDKSVYKILDEYIKKRGPNK